MSGDGEIDLLMAGLIDANAKGEAHRAPLDEDNIPDENQSHYCLSCDAPMKALYCGECGQKNDDFRRSLWDLGWEVIGSFTALENKIWRTWLSLLFKPGRVPRGFADGERVRWSTPIRVYIFMSILLFGYMEVSGTQFVAIDINVEDSLEATTPDLSLTPLFFVREAEVDARNDGKDFQRIHDVLEAGNYRFSLNWDGDGLDFETEAEAEAEVEVGQDGEGDFVLVEPEERSDFANFISDFARKPAVVNSILGTWLPRVIFLMMPLTMLLGAVFIRGRRKVRVPGKFWRQRDPTAQRALLYDHGVHAAYVHAVAYFLFFAAIVIGQITHSSLFAKAACLAMMIYLPISLRRMFRRSWIKTLWTSYAVGFLYLLIVFVAMSTLLALGLADHIAEQRANLP